MTGGSNVESGFQPITKEFRDFWPKFSSAVATEVVTSNVKQRLARIHAILLVLLESNEKRRGNLEALSTTQKGVLIACSGRGPHRPSVPLLGFDGFTAHSGTLAIFWLRERELGTILQGIVGTGLMLLGVYYTIIQVSGILRTCLFSPLDYP